MEMTREDGTLTTEVGKDMGKEGPAKKKNAILELLGFAGKRRVLAYVGCCLSILNAVLTVMPLVCVWFVVRDLISVYPNWAEASSAAMWAVLARGFRRVGHYRVFWCAHGFASCGLPYCGKYAQSDGSPRGADPNGIFQRALVRGDAPRDRPGVQARQKTLSPISCPISSALSPPR